MDNRDISEPGIGSNLDKSRNTLTYASIYAGILWLVIGGLLIYFFQDRSVTEIFMGGHSLISQLFMGVIIGVAFGLTGVAGFRNEYLRRTLDDYFIVNQLREYSITGSQVIHISLVAGITEEILFRAAIQPLIGIWWTSLLFVAIHGYIRFKTAGHIIFTCFTFALSMALGLLTIHSGLIAAISAHSIYDMILLRVLKNEDGRNELQGKLPTRSD